MKAATLFSGIGAPEEAMPGWEWLWHAEVEPFPCAVMRARHPASPNLGDVTAHDFAERARRAGRPDVVVFGSPCQSFSVAGRRLGLDDPRGNLALAALGVVARLEPRWFVFENVPGLLSSADGRDFGLFLRAVDELGYSACWAVLDAQHFGVAQRRQRVFLVGHLGDWRRAAAVLLEPEGLRGDSPPRREAGERVAPTVEARARAGGAGWGTDFLAGGGMAEGEVAGTLLGGHDTGHNHGKRSGSDRATLVAFNNTGQGWWNDSDTASPVRTPEGSGSLEATLVAFGGNRTEGPVEVATAVRAKGGTGHGDFESETFVAHPLRADGFDASEDGTGRDTPLIADLRNGSMGDVATTLQGGGMGDERGLCPNAIPHVFQADDYRGCSYEEAEVARPLTTSPDRSRAAPITCQGEEAKAVSLRGRDGGGTAELGGAQAAALRGSQGGGDKPHVLAFSAKDHGADAVDDLAPTLRGMGEVDGNANGGGQVAVAVHENQRAETTLSDTAGSLKVGRGKPGQGYPAVAVRTAQTGANGCGVAGVAHTLDGWNAQAVATSAVRRLTPRECERLQGFPDDYTAVPYRGKPAADGPRYKALGNSMAVPVVRWILRRLELVDKL